MSLNEGPHVIRLYSSASDVTDVPIDFNYVRLIRAELIEVLSQDYLRTARAKGLRERVVIARHAIRNALIPVITVVGLRIPVLFAGAVVTEAIFSWPGMGQIFFQAVLASDWPVVQAIIVITAFLVIVSNLLADLLYAVVDPRITYR